MGSRDVGMGFFDAIADYSFIETKNGRVTFYPWGVFGRGCVLPTEEKHHEIRRFVKRYYGVSLPLFFILLMFDNFLVALLAVPIIYLSYHLMVRRLTKGLPQADQRISPLMNLRISAAKSNAVVLWLLEIFLVLFVLAGFVVLIIDEDRLIAVACILLFGLCSVGVGYMIRVKRALARQRGLTGEP